MAEEDEASGEDEAVTTAVVAQKVSTLDLAEPETQAPHSDDRAENKNTTMMAQQTEEQKLLEENKSKK